MVLYFFFHIIDNALKVQQFYRKCISTCINWQYTSSCFNRTCSKPPEWLNWGQGDECGSYRHSTHTRSVINRVLLLIPIGTCNEQGYKVRAGSIQESSQSQENNDSLWDEPESLRGIGPDGEEVINVLFISLTLSSDEITESLTAIRYLMKRLSFYQHLILFQQDVSHQYKHFTGFQSFLSGNVAMNHQMSQEEAMYLAMQPANHIFWLLNFSHQTKSILPTRMHFEMLFCSPST